MISFDGPIWTQLKKGQVLSGKSWLKVDGLGSKETVHSGELGRLKRLKVDDQKKYKSTVYESERLKEIETERSFGMKVDGLLLTV